MFGSSSQEGDIGRNTLFPLTTKKRTTTNLKTINDENYQNIKLHGTPIIKELNKHSSRSGGAEMGRQAESGRLRRGGVAEQ